MKLEWQTLLGWVSFEDQHGPPYKDGVYVITEVLNDGEIARYVGKGNISERISAHKSDNGQNDKLKNLIQSREYKIHYALISDERKRANVEYTLFTYYNRTRKLYNKATPEGRLCYTLEFPDFKESN